MPAWRPGRRSAAVAGLLCALAALYVFAAGTGDGRAVDGNAYHAIAEGPLEPVADVVVAALNPVSALLLALMLVVSGARHGKRTSWAVALLLIGSNVSAWVMEHVLGELDPLGGETSRVLGPAFFPSGHATAAFSLALGAVLVAPARARRGAIVACAAAALAFGFAVVASSAHTPADVVGALLLVGAWGVALAPMAEPVGPVRRGAVRFVPSRDG